MKPSMIQKAIQKLNEEMDRFEKAVGGPIKAWFSKCHKKRCEELDLRLAEIRAKCPHKAASDGTNYCQYCGGDLTQSNPPTL